MKALDLTVHGTHCIPDGPGNITTVYHDTDYGRNVYDWKADQIGQRKRLTDAELMAEAYREAALRFESLAGYAYAKGERDAVASILHKETHDEHRRRLSILRRFATLPHYDEDQP